MAHTYDYAIVRVVPRVDRGELINAGVIVLCPGAKFLAAGFALDEQRLRALDPRADVEAIREHLAAIERVCRGGKDAGALGQLTARQRFDWLTAPRSSVIQMSPVHTGRAEKAENVVEHLLDKVVRVKPLG